ncbi:MAG TPA: hypothetical protein VNV15_07105 [Opitutaceae bacterium]|nr:hypothetical protein [Opitutaceae bacterium]
MLLILAFIGSPVIGVICLVLAIIKRSWKGAAWAIGGMVGAMASIVGLAYLYSLALDNSLHRPVSEKEVVGVWQLTDESLAMAKKTGPDPYRPSSGRIYQIDLRPDKTCRYCSLLVMPTRYVDCQGTWSIAPMIGQKDVSELNMHVLVDGSQNGFSLEFGETKGALFLWSYWDDPDDGDLLKYQKKPSK